MKKVETYSDHQSGMPNANYLKMVARSEYAWEHRMQQNPLDGFPKTGTINFIVKPNG